MWIYGLKWEFTGKCRWKVHFSENQFCAFCQRWRIWRNLGISEKYWVAIWHQNSIIFIGLQSWSPEARRWKRRQSHNNGQQENRPGSKKARPHLPEQPRVAVFYEGVPHSRLVLFRRMGFLEEIQSQILQPLRPRLQLIRPKTKFPEKSIPQNQNRRKKGSL